MTPALPGEAPDPSATPRLDALLKEVEAGYFASARDMGDLRHAYPNVRRHNEGLADGLLAPTIRRIEASTHAPRLAAMLRVAVEALDANLDSSNVVPSKMAGWRLVSAEVLSMARAALARIEAMAKGES